MTKIIVLVTVKFHVRAQIIRKLVPVKGFGIVACNFMSFGKCKGRLAALRGVGIVLSRQAPHDPFVVLGEFVVFEVGEAPPTGTVPWSINDAVSVGLFTFRPLFFSKGDGNKGDGHKGDGKGYAAQKKREEERATIERRRKRREEEQAANANNRNKDDKSKEEEGEAKRAKKEGKR